MRSIAIVALLLAACADDGSTPGPHDDVACDPHGWPLQKCDRACKMMPAAGTPGGCTYTNTIVHPSQQGTCTAGAQVSFDGLAGCCLPDVTGESGEQRVIFFECQ